MLHLQRDRSISKLSVRYFNSFQLKNSTTFGDIGENVHFFLFRRVSSSINPGICKYYNEMEWNEIVDREKDTKEEHNWLWYRFVLDRIAYILTLFAFNVGWKIILNNKITF